MKEKCVIHIGMNKTGSSSIQKTLYKQLTDENYAYVDLGASNHSRRIKVLFGERPGKYKNPETKGLNKGEVRRLKLGYENSLVKSFSRGRFSNFIISGEGILNLSSTELTAMKDFLELYFNRVVIVGYVRSPMSYMSSNFQQRLKAGLGSFDLDRMYPKYREKFEKFDQVFDQENVDLRKFDPKNFPQGNVVLDFCQCIGIEMPLENTIRVNDSLTKEAVSLMFSYNKFHASSNKRPSLSVNAENGKLIDELRKIGKSKLRLSPSLMKPILEKNKEDIEWMEARLGKSLTEDLAESAECIRNENDLLNTSPEIINEISMLIGDERLAGKTWGDTPEEVAELIEILKLKLASSEDGKQSKRNKKIELTSLEIAKKIQQDNQAELGNMNANWIASIISAALTQIKNELETTDNSSVRISEFGKFNIHSVEKNKAGQKVIAKRTIFKVAKEK